MFSTSIQQKKENLFMKTKTTMNEIFILKCPLAFSWSLKLYSSSSSCRAPGTGLFDPLSPPVYRPREVFKTISCIGTKLLYIGSCWLSSLCSSIRRDQQEYIANMFIFNTPAVSRMFGSSNFDSFRDGW